MIAEKYKQILVDIIKKYLPTAKIYLFGSRAKDYHDSGSDVDLAVDVGTKIPIETLLDIAYDISESVIPYFVDVIDLRSVDQKFYQSIEKDLILWNP